MTNSSIDLRAPADRLYLISLFIYLGTVLCFSSFFYLTTEDYEAVIATRLIGQGMTIGKSTGWPYTPLAPYLFYPYAALFGENILAFRIMTVGLTLAAVFPIYWVLRTLCPPFLSFALTWFSFSLTTFPHPRLEYYVEAAFLAFAIYFAVKVIRANERRDVYLCAIFLFAAFASRGFPNVAILIGIMPIALAAVQMLIRPRANTATQSTSPGRLKWKRIGSFLLFACCAGFLIAFMKKTVHNVFFYEYASLTSPGNFAPLKEARSAFGIILPAVLIILYLLSRTKLCSAWAGTKECRDDSSPAHEANVYQTFLPFVLCGLAFLALGAVVFPIQDLLFFLFPLDIFLDHSRQLSSGRSYVVPLFVSLLAFLVFLWIFGQTEIRKLRVALFLVCLLPATFARFFPTYNMLYLMSFAVAAFACVILPQFLRIYFSDRTSIAASVQWALAIFFILYAAAANVALLVATQVADLSSGRLVRMERGPLKGIFIEKDIADFFLAVHNNMETIAGPSEKAAFLSNRYLNYVPLVYGRADVFAGQNLVGGLGKLWSYDDLVKRDGALSNTMIYKWRNHALELIQRADIKTIVMSLYDPAIVKRALQPSSDPFKEYLRQNFVIAEVIAPAMKMHRRSAFSEGAVILVRKPRV